MCTSSIPILHYTNGDFWKNSTAQKWCRNHLKGWNNDVQNSSNIFWHSDLGLERGWQSDMQKISRSLHQTKSNHLERLCQMCGKRSLVMSSHREETIHVVPESLLTPVCRNWEEKDMLKLNTSVTKGDMPRNILANFVRKAQPSCTPVWDKVARKHQRHTPAIRQNQDKISSVSNPL